jgi:hypothetical protein
VLFIFLFVFFFYNPPPPPPPPNPIARPTISVGVLVRKRGHFAAICLPLRIPRRSVLFQ